MSRAACGCDRVWPLLSAGAHSDQSLMTICIHVDRGCIPGVSVSTQRFDVVEFEDVKNGVPPPRSPSRAVSIRRSPSGGARARINLERGRPTSLRSQGRPQMSDGRGRARRRWRGGDKTEDARNVHLPLWFPGPRGSARRGRYHGLDADHFSLCGCIEGGGRCLAWTWCKANRNICPH
jgi:hypothetical protein